LICCVTAVTLVGGLAAHEPRDEVGAVAPEVGERAGAALARVGQPGEELAGHADLLGPRVAVVHHDLADRAERRVAVHEGVRGVRARVPGGLVVGEQVHAVAARERRHALRVRQAHGERLLDHHVHPARGRGFDHAQVLADGAEGEHRLGPRAVEHRGSEG
jgi:hypothetical protein